MGFTLFKSCGWDTGICFQWWTVCQVWYLVYLVWPLLCKRWTQSRLSDGELVDSKNGLAMRPQRNPRIADCCVSAVAELPLFCDSPIPPCTILYMLLQYIALQCRYSWLHIEIDLWVWSEYVRPRQCFNAFGRFCCSQRSLAALCNNSNCRPAGVKMLGGQLQTSLVHEGFGGCNQLGPSPELGFEISHQKQSCHSRTCH